MKFGDLRPRGDSESLPRERKAMKFGDLRPRNASQEEPKDSGGFFNTLGNAFDWWKGNSLAGAGYLGGLLSEIAGVYTTKAITYDGDGVLHISPSNHSTIVMGVQNVNNSYQFIVEKPATLTGGSVTGTIYASETDNYKAASVDFTFTY